MTDREVLRAIQIAKADRVTVLDLSGRRLNHLPAEIGSLRSLTRLSLHSNSLKELPPEIGDLENLTYLGLNYNQLTDIPQEIGKLSHLSELLIGRNRLKSLPLELGTLSSLRLLQIDRNPISDVPPEILELGTHGILAYLRERLQDSSRQWLSKLLVVGEGGVGKTSLLAALNDESFKEQQETTHGIQIRAIDICHPTERDVVMRLNAWDFGGQEIYHATHQFFLTNRSLFLLVWNSRHGYEQGRLYYWLDTIRALAPDSPVLLVATWTDERDADIPISDLKRRYPQIVGQLDVSNRTHAGIAELRTTIARLASDLPLMGEEWPTSWLRVANVLRSMPEKHIDPSGLWDLTYLYKIDPVGADVLAQWLHELGDILYYRNNDELNDHVILKPQWVTEYVSKVLESEEVIRRNGIFTKSHMVEIWRDLSPSMRDHFLRLMEAFDLSYRTLENKEISLVVERLPLDEPQYGAIWDPALVRDDCRQVSMRFELSTVPAGIPTWFIARTHRFTTHVHWRTGAVFADDIDKTHLALVKASPHERTLELSVRGPNPQNFFALLKDGIEVTLARFPGLKIRRLIPCPGHSGQPCGHYFEYEQLLKRLNRRHTIECPEALEDITVVELLFGIHWTTQDEVLLRLDQLEAADAFRHTELLGELRNLTELAQREFANAFRREQARIDSHCPNVFLLSPQHVDNKSKSLREAVAGKSWRLELYCQAPGHWHPTGPTGSYDIAEPAKWLAAASPFLGRLVKVLKYTAPLVGPSLGLSLGEEIDALRYNIRAMEELVKKLPEDEIIHDREIPTDLQQLVGPEWAEGSALRAVRTMLERVDPEKRWGGLRKILTPEGHYLWLCDQHAAEYLT